MTVPVHPRHECDLDTETLEELLDRGRPSAIENTTYRSRATTSNPSVEVSGDLGEQTSESKGSERFSLAFTYAKRRAKREDSTQKRAHHADGATVSFASTQEMAMQMPVRMLVCVCCLWMCVSNMCCVCVLRSSASRREGRAGIANTVLSDPTDNVLGHAAKQHCCRQRRREAWVQDLEVQPAPLFELDPAAFLRPDVSVRLLVLHPHYLLHCPDELCHRELEGPV